MVSPKPRRLFSKWLLPALLLAGVSAFALHKRALPSLKDSRGGDTSSPQGPIRFVDVAAQAGINYKWTLGRRPTNILQGVGQGCAFLDINNDGNLDILLVGRKLALYLGDGKGHFTEATRQYGLDRLHGEFDGCCVGDYDNDGFDDIYISGYKTGLLLHNERGQTLRDVTTQMGIRPQRWGTSCAFVDVDGDGLLDLFIGNYVNYDPKVKPNCNRDGKEITCGPRDYDPIAPTLYHNLGSRFEDVTASWEIASNGGNLGVACADYDGSGHDSIYVANDLRLGDMLRRVDKNHFINMGMMVGVSGTPMGSPHAGMGTDWGDFDNDGKLDLVVTTFQNEPRSLYHNMGNGAFMDVAMMIGMQGVQSNHLAFGVKFIDVNNDGWLDMLIANGHVQDNVEAFEPKSRFHQNMQLLLNSGEDRPHLSDISRQAGLNALSPIVGRGLAIGDFDNDGRMDALVTNSDGAPQLLHNESVSSGHWLLCKLVGSKSNRDGIGALVTFDLGDRKLLRRCGADGSYLSSSDRRVHAGLGADTQVDISIHWPSGSVSTHKNIKADQIVTLTEP